MRREHGHRELYDLDERHRARGAAGRAPRVEGGDAIYTSSQTYVHAHAFAIAQAVLLSPPADGISGSSTEIEQHAHTVTITQAELQAVAALQAVRVRTGDALGHNHVFTIVKVA